jgi:acylphosphatase
MTSPVVARRVVVAGHVQGVFFRDCTLREANRLGVVGWVRNCADGTVEALFEGPPDAVAELIRWCRSGPPYATVNDVHVSDVEPDGRHGFSIR